MARAIVMPSFGMYTVEGSVVRWLRPAGAFVTAGDPVLEVETEKAVQEIIAPESGFLYHATTPGTVLTVEAIAGFILADGEPPPDLHPQPHDVRPETPER